VLYLYSKPIQSTRATTVLLPPLESTPSFLITKANKSYKHQYANIYFVRLRLLRQFLEENALLKWKNVSGKPVLVPRVLDVVKGQLCYIIGTVYMEMPLKPNVMEDIARDVRALVPP
jgi:DNA polymerase delta subunit 2